MQEFECPVRCSDWFLTGGPAGGAFRSEGTAGTFKFPHLRPGGVSRLYPRMTPLEYDVAGSGFG